MPSAYRSRSRVGVIAFYGSETTEGITSDNNLLIHWDDMGFKSGTLRTYLILSPNSMGIEAGVQDQPAPLHAVADAGSYRWCILADAPAEDDSFRLAPHR